MTNKITEVSEARDTEHHSEPDPEPEQPKSPPTVYDIAMQMATFKDRPAPPPADQNEAAAIKGGQVMTLDGEPHPAASHRTVLQAPDLTTSAGMTELLARSAMHGHEGEKR